MTTFLVRRLGFLVFVVFGVSVLTFAISHLVPADPVALVAGKETSPEKLAQIRHIYGLDKPLPPQYVTYMERLLQGDFRGAVFQHDQNDPAHTGGIEWQHGISRDRKRCTRRTVRNDCNECRHNDNSGSLHKAAHFG